MNDLPLASDYWRNKSGAEYRDQQQLRIGAGNTSYREQERWLLDYLAAASRALQRPARVLDFGCGFGRFTRLLANVDHIDYYGYDFSANMIEPMFDDPPIEREALQRRVRVADTVGAAFPQGEFDFIFTVSVLIHNPPEAARRLLEQMLALLSAGGSIVLIENALCALSVRESNWHAGCWLHDVAGTLAPDLSLDAYADVVPGHAIYVLSRPTAGDRYLRLGTAGGSLVDARLSDFRLSGLEHLAHRLGRIEEELELGARIVGGAHDQWELLDTTREKVRTLERRHDALTREHDALTRQRDALTSQVPQLNSEIDVLRAQQTRLEAAFESRSRLRRQIARLSVEHDPALVRRHWEEAGTPEQVTFHFFQWNHAQDIRYAHSDERFAPVAHVFHMDWKGIRAAAGCLPGHKLAIKSDRIPSAQEMEQILDLLRACGVDRIVMHGMSDAMQVLHSVFAAEGIATFLVWHGTTAQWVWPDERRFALMALKLARDGAIKRFSAIRRGLDAVAGATYFHPQLLNPVPRMASDARSKRTDPDRKTALAPSWNDLRKNLATNLLAAEGVPQLERTYVFAKDLDLPEWIVPKVVQLHYPGPHALPDILRGVDLVLNVTTIDCHPMVDLEALACHVPCVRGPLFLDALEAHEYARLTVVDNPLSVADIAARARNLLQVPPDQVRAMMADYATRLTSIAIDRYAEFTGV